MYIFHYLNILLEKSLLLHDNLALNSEPLIFKIGCHCTIASLFAINVSTKQLYCQAYCKRKESGLYRSVQAAKLKCQSRF